MYYIVLHMKRTGQQIYLKTDEYWLPDAGRLIALKNTLSDDMFVDGTLHDGGTILVATEEIAAVTFEYQDTDASN